MLESLLRVVAEGGIHSYDSLGKRLAISQPLLEVMLEDLAKLGYLRRVEAECGKHCTSCSIGSCSVTGPGRLWALTDKGVRAAARLSA